MTFVIPGEPRGKGRPRFTKSGSVYTDNKTKQYEFLVQFLAKVAMKGNPPATGPCRVFMVAYLPIPKRTSKKQALAMLRGEVLPEVKPDEDNILKAIQDGMNGIVYVDDKQVTWGEPVKRYGENPRVEVYVGADAGIPEIPELKMAWEV